MKNKVYLLLLTALFVSNIHPVSSQIIRTKDGEIIGTRNQLIKECVGDEDPHAIDMNLGISVYDYCSCSMKIFEQINSWELIEAERNNQVEELIMREDNLSILIECLYDMNTGYQEEPTAESSEISELEKSLFLKLCAKEFQNSDKNGEWTVEEAEAYCECTITNIIDKGYNFDSVEGIDDENSSIYNEVIIPCLKDLVDQKSYTKSKNHYNKRDIVGGGRRITVPLIDSPRNQYKVRLSIGGQVKYFTLDTGASDLVINRALERELILDGAIKRSDYLGKKDYILANNTRVEGQLVRIDNIQIGEYTVNNVVIAIVEDASLLLGKSFLDKLQDWSINTSTKELILYK